MAKITINVSPDGSIDTDFKGFEGESCFAQADKLNEILKGLGVSISSKSVMRKTSEKQAIALKNKNPNR
ncbi:MAG TPA: DUF2997 domain-containing protein [candidate division CPR3 bacterium]|uniref:DUF2997 domain-containing protein n=1 Tax=candidate division CPR3 bacterium TaxID=2268181 RepID=A0A7C1SP02_UNCC3|nr:DUF2997 domain-containing protein [candidate division CPR3 bacterium]